MSETAEASEGEGLADSDLSNGQFEPISTGVEDSPPTTQLPSTADVALSHDSPEGTSVEEHDQQPSNNVRSYE